MVALMADMQIAEAYMQNHNYGYQTDSIRDSAVQWALDRRGISKAEFDSTMTWYGKNLDEYRDLYEKVDKELTKRQKRISGEEIIETDYSDLWPYSRHIMIAETGNTNSLSFTFPTDQLSKGDKIMWKMHVNGNPAVNLMLGVEYDNGTSGYVSQSNNDVRKLDISFQTDTSLQVKKIYGYVRVKEDRYLPVWIDSISLQASPLDSTQYYRVHSQRKVGVPKRIIMAKENEEKGESDSVPTTDKFVKVESVNQNNVHLRPIRKRNNREVLNHRQ